MFEVRPGYRVIRSRGRIRVLAADADTADGVIPTLAIVDELHRHPSGPCTASSATALGDGQMITISTAGATLDSPLAFPERARAFDVAQVKKRRTYTSPDGSFVLVEWALDTDDDHQDLNLVKDVNPAPWHTKTAAPQARFTVDHARPVAPFACGIWTAGDEPTTAARLWDAARVDIGGVDPPIPST